MMAQHECCLGSFMIFQGIRTSIAKKPYIFVIFQWGGGGSGSSNDGSIKNPLDVIAALNFKTLPAGGFRS